MKTKNLLKLGLPFCLVLSACGSDTRDREDYGDITKGPGGVVLVNPDEHIGGWGRNQCTMCHNILNIHQRPGNGLAPKALRDVFHARNNDTSYCMLCHGKNGT